MDTTDDGSAFPKKLRLMNSKEDMKCKKVKAVIRCHTPKNTKEPDKYFHNLLMLYYPWREESELLGNEQTYRSKFYEPEVQTVVKHHRNIFEPDAEAVVEALELLRSNNHSFLHSYDAINNQENDDLQSQIQSDSNDLDESFNNQISDHLAPSTEQQPEGAITTYNQPLEISDDDLRQSVRSLNTLQRKAYEIVLSWCRNKIKNRNSLKPVEVQLIHLFVTGGASAGKSHQINTIYHTTTKSFRDVTNNPEQPTVLLMAPTGVAAININGPTIHTALAIPKESGDNVPPTSDQKRTQTRMSLSELKLIIIDEISMISNTTLLDILQKLK